MFEDFTAAAKYAVQKACQFARQEQQLASPRHLMLAVLHEPGGVLRDALKSLGLDVEGRSMISTARIVAQLGGTQLAVDADVRKDVLTLSSFTKPAVIVLRGAMEEANLIGAPYIAPSHIFLSALLEGSVYELAPILAKVCPLEDARKMVVQAVSAAGMRVEAGEEQ